jgi:NADPH-dependent 2,4-dienoyl-CoA reductase/sulfur reductase-like enzyme/nitrite reductase/ring-hydroxylating ferredoxin subunit
MSTSARHVAQLSELHADRATRVVVDGKPILLVRDGDTVRGYSADCPHAGGPLEEGALCHGRIVCPWHKGQFDVSTGNVLEPPALVGLDRYPVTVSGDDVLVSPEKLPEAAPATPSADPHYVVIGAGAAGAAACAALRENGFAGRITLIGEEPYAPYDRTSLSKFVPSGEMAADDIPPLLPQGWEAQHEVERITAKVTGLDVPGRTIHFEAHDEIVYDTALLATGSVPNVPSIAGRELAGVHVLRNRNDAVRLVEAIGETTRVVILGSSFIGLETASSLRTRGVHVTVVAPGKIPFEKQFGERIGLMFRELHANNGVVFRLGETVASLGGERGCVREVVLRTAERIPADVVLLGTGVRPATGFVEGLTLRDDGGVTVNARMQAAPGLYAAGDIAAFPIPAVPAARHEERVEHWRVAQQHARIAAQNMCGVPARYAGVPYFWTYHAGKNFEYLGHASEWDDIVIHGALDSQHFVALYVKDGKVAAVLACEHEAQTARLIESMRRPLSAADALKIVKGE